jgi:bifunctional non-homologous end joining protein LigD
MKLFTPFKPMELKKVKELPLDNEKYIYQIKWDGIRGLVHSDGQEVRVFNRNLADKTLQYPELQELLKWNKKIILDGEIIVLNEGLPSFTQVIRRDFASSKTKIASLRKVMPIVYCVFDILFYEDRSLINLPLLERLKYLEVLREENLPFIYFTEIFNTGKDLFEQTKEKKMEGIVAKEVLSPYEIGYKSGKWLKIKHRRLQNCVVCGYTTKELRPSALVLGAYNAQEELIYVGRAASGLTGQELALLKEGAKPLISKKPHILNPPQDNLTYIWLVPKLTVLVEFSEWTEDLKLRIPVIKGFTNISPEKCRI